MATLADELQRVLRHEIPLTESMGLAVARYEAGCLTLHAPLAANINHKDTAFAGSLNALATLAGWGIVWLMLREAGEEAVIVIQESAIHYRAPVRTELVATCRLPDAHTCERFVATLRTRHKARLALSVTIGPGDRPAVEFRGRYIAHRPGVLG